jgi:hypothetical protein
MTHTDESVTSFSSEARLIRVNKVFRVMRILRVMRLVRFIQVMRARLLHQDLSLELVEQLRTITLLTTFARAHMYAQDRFLKLFGTRDKCQTAEEARCIIESQTAVYKAITMAAIEAKKVDPAVLKGVTMLKEGNRVAEILSGFIVHAHADGVISSREAESILHPLTNHRRLWTKHLQQSHSGVHTDVDLTAEDAGQEKGERDEVEKSLEAWCAASERHTGLLQSSNNGIGSQDATFRRLESDQSGLSSNVCWSRVMSPSPLGLPGSAVPELGPPMLGPPIAAWDGTPTRDANRSVTEPARQPTHTLKVAIP